MLDLHILVVLLQLLVDPTLLGAGFRIGGGFQLASINFFTAVCGDCHSALFDTYEIKRFVIENAGYSNHI